MKGIRKLPSGAWEIRYYAPGGNGRPTRLSESFHGTATEAQRRRDALVHAARTGKARAGGRLTLNEWTVTWQRRRQHDDQLRPRTKQDDSELLARYILPRWGALRLDQLRQPLLREWYTELRETGGQHGQGLAPRTVGGIHECLSKVLAAAVRDRLLPEHPMLGLKKPAKGDVPVAVMSRAEVDTFLAAAQGHEFEALFRLALGTGMRRGEIAALRWANVDLVRGQITVAEALVALKGRVEVAPPKTRRGRRTFFLPATVVTALAAHQERQAAWKRQVGPAYGTRDLVFARPDGRPYHPRALSGAFRRLADTVALATAHFHTQRHTAISAMLAAGAPLTEVAAVAGHRPDVTARVYAHPWGGGRELATRLEAALFGPEETP